MLSKLGFCSRSRAALLIQAGRVRLNGAIRRDPQIGTLETDEIAVDGRAIHRKEKVYLVVNKPRGLVTTASDEQGRKTIYSILETASESLPWVSAVGRLDKASEGLLLMTNDSEWAARVADPETHLEKTYHVQIDTLADERLIEAMKCGVRLEGDLLKARDVEVLRSGEKNCWLKVTLDEGKNRQIRRMLATLGVEVLRLVRVSIGPLELGTLPKGSYRQLTAAEKSALDRAMASAGRSSRRAQRTF